MPKPPKAVHTGEAKSRRQHSVGKLRFYEILYNLNQGFGQVRRQLQQPEHEPYGLQRHLRRRLEAESCGVVDS
jgi:hypothetical protein